MTVVPFRRKPPRPINDREDLAAAIFAAASQRGIDANIVGADLLRQFPGLTMPELHSAFACSSRVLSTFHSLLIEKLSGNDGEPAA
jgi:hypothetical protein